jgi:hypothetical protein
VFTLAFYLAVEGLDEGESLPLHIASNGFISACYRAVTLGRKNPNL